MACFEAVMRRMAWALMGLGLALSMKAAAAWDAEGDSLAARYFHAQSLAQEKQAAVAVLGIALDARSQGLGSGTGPAWWDVAGRGRQSGTLRRLRALRSRQEEAESEARKWAAARDALGGALTELHLQKRLGDKGMQALKHYRQHGLTAWEDSRPKTPRPALGR
jgi:hypothetical protein